MTVNSGTNANVFKVFIEKILVPVLWPGAVVVMDNLAAHKVKGVKEMIEKVGAKIIYLSPYSPDFNPIENCWSKLKQYIRSGSTLTREILDKTIALGLNLITLKDIHNWFTHCCYCTSSY